MNKLWAGLILAGVLSVNQNRAEDQKTSTAASEPNITPIVNETINSGGNDTSSQEHLEEIKKWPKIFVLNYNPDFPIVCYSGVMFIPNNETNSHNESESEKGANSTEMDRTHEIYTLSTDPRYPVTCRVIPANLTEGIAEFTVDEDDEKNGTNITCIRRDYEENVSAIFIHKAGPLQLAWNIFNTTQEYGYMTVDENSIGPVKVLNETIVDCEEYSLKTADKNIGANAACALCG